MLDFLVSLFTRLTAEWQTRRFLKKCRVILPTGEEVSGRHLIRAARLAQQQALLRQVYGLLSGGGQCVVTFSADEKSAEVVPLQRK